VSNPFDYITEFETALASYTGARYAVMTDCCTHALELAFRATEVTSTEFTPYTYISIPMMLMKLGVRFEYNEVEVWAGSYYFQYTNIWDSARALYPDMYKPGQIQCLSFGHDKPMTLGRGGAILLDDQELYKQLKLMCYDGRDLNTQPWESQKEFKLGYHYKPTPEEALKGIQALSMHEGGIPEYKPYPDLRKIKINA
jgi:dTDP-4-amino-4,6-dideoxygalactose transaminase